MRLEDELEPKLTEISRWATELFTNMELRKYGLHFDENGQVAIDWGSPMNQPTLGQPWDEEAQRQLVAVTQEKVSTFHSDLESLLARFRAYYPLDSLDLTAVAGIFGGQGAAQTDAPPTNIHGRIGYARGLVAYVEALVNERHWSGEGAREFHTQVVERFRDTAQKQQGYVTELALATQVLHDYVVAIDKALLQVADQCIGALGGPSQPTQEELDQAVMGLSIASIVFGALSLFPPLAPVAGPVSLGAGIASFVIPLAVEGDPEPRIAVVGGDTVWDVIQSTWAALTTVERSFTDGDVKLGAGLEQDLTSADALANPGLAMDPPALTNRPGRETFHTLTFDSSPDVPGEDPVVVSIVELYRAGKVNLAGAAGQYAQASQELRFCTMPAALPGFFPRSVAKFDEARDRLDGLLARTGNAVDAAGVALVDAANAYQLSDEQAAEVIRQTSQMHTPSAAPEPARYGGV